MTTAAAHPATRRVSRDDIVRIGQAGRPWDFLPMAFQVIAIAPEDWGMRILAAANFARLGLRTAAEEELAALPADLKDDPNVAGLAKALRVMAPDRVPAAELAATCRKNLEALAARGIDLEDAFAPWSRTLEETQWYRAGDGNLVLRRDGVWLAFGDRRSLAVKPAQVDTFVLEGIDPPWLLLKVEALATRDKSGFQPRITILQADPLEFLDGLAHTDLRTVLARDRLLVYVGPDASERFRDDLSAQLDRKLTALYMPLPSLRTRCRPEIRHILTDADTDQLHECEKLRAEAEEIYRGRDRVWWARRFDDARSGIEPLRVLVPTSRYTTYVRHAAGDLAAAFRRHGCRAEVLIEPDDHSHISLLTYVQAIADLRPDLVVLINYTRNHPGFWWPPELPFVCWIQDAMPHQFDADIGRRQGDLDFVVGHVYEELIRRFDYPRERTLNSPVVACGNKFHGGAVAPDLCRRFECEVAMVSHHSETPEAMHERLLRESGSVSGSQRAMLDDLRRVVHELARDPMSGPVHARLEAACRQAARNHLGADPDAGTLARLHKNYCLPLADRVLRHQTLAWAAELAAEHGWRLHIYGKGWETHTRFGPFARGELPHGEELRAAYQCAAVHLHASINTIAHQRVMECALSGGLPLCRLVYEPLRTHEVAAIRAALLRSEPCVCDPATRRHGYFIADNPESMEVVSLFQRLGRPVPEFWWISDKHLAAIRSDRNALLDSLADPSVWLLGDMAETTFTSKERLGELLRRAVSDPAWRSAWSNLIAGRVRARFTHDRLAEQILELVRGASEPCSSEGGR